MKNLSILLYVVSFHPTSWDIDLRFHMSCKFKKIMCFFPSIQFSSVFKRSMTYTGRPYTDFGLWESCGNKTDQSTSNSNNLVYRLVKKQDQGDLCPSPGFYFDLYFILRKFFDFVTFQLG